MTTYCQVANHQLETHATDYIIAETDNEIAFFVKPFNKSPLEFSNGVQPNKGTGPHVCDECDPKGIFIKKLMQSIRHSMRSF